MAELGNGSTLLKRSLKRNDRGKESGRNIGNLILLQALTLTFVYVLVGRFVGFLSSFSLITQSNKNEAVFITNTLQN
ncbi:unnamed protein product [Heterobilharzia americana]|nr:unnamed protein product [Heterobilharzia americana]